MMLAGKSALVTGGASGIGAATALAMAREGARVLVADRNDPAATVAAINAAGGQALGMVADVTDEEAVAAMVARAVGAFGRLDCAFNNAGIAPAAIGKAGVATGDTERAAWEAVLAVNLTGVFLCLRAEIQAMRGKGGAIVNTASIAGMRALTGAAAYVASKHGVIGLTRTAAAEEAPGIRVNAVCPGFVDTPMTADVRARRGPAIEARAPMRRFGRPEEIAEVVVFLCSDRASFIAGSAWTADGGYAAL
jgi:NAD(P)-dependent dehydrogenase (short-subunit alcohol dehydrogenase family)